MIRTPVGQIGRHYETAYGAGDEVSWVPLYDAGLPISWFLRNTLWSVQEWSTGKRKSEPQKRDRKRECIQSISQQGLRRMEAEGRQFQEAQDGVS
jgi:hypothetical protein